MFLVEPDKFDGKRHLRGFLFIMHHYQILMREERQRSEKETLFCPVLLTSLPQISDYHHLKVVIITNLEQTQKSA